MLFSSSLKLKNVDSEGVFFYEQCGYADFCAVVSVFILQINIETCQCERRVQQSLACCLLQAVFLLFLLFNLEVEASVPLKLPLNFNRQHGVISQKMNSL
jgi:hypothetical protein